MESIVYSSMIIRYIFDLMIVDEYTKNEHDNNVNENGHFHFEIHTI